MFKMKPSHKSKTASNIKSYLLLVFTEMFLKTVPNKLVIAKMHCNFASTTIRCSWTVTVLTVF